MTAHDNQVQPNTNKPEHGPRDVDAVNKWSKHPNHNNNLYSRQLVLPLQSSFYEVLFTATAEPYTYIDQLARFMDMFMDNSHSWPVGPERVAGGG